MNILLVLFKTRNMNVQQYKALKHCEAFKHVETIYIADEKSINIDIKGYDYILFANPNFTFNHVELEQAIQTLQSSDATAVQWTLRDVKYLKQMPYTYNNYREWFATILIRRDETQEHCDLMTYFQATATITSKAYISANYIGRNTQNKVYKHDIIDLTIDLLESLSTAQILGGFASKKDLIHFLDFVIDNQVFERDVDKEKQLKLMKIIAQKFSGLKELRERKQTRLYLFYGLVFKRYFDEALSALTLYRSRRYWYQVNQNLEQNRDNEFEQLRTSDAWIKTQKYRDARIKLQLILKYLEKYSLKCFAHLFKMIIHKPIWLISERKDSASDNSYFLFKYLTQQCSEIKAYYILDKHAKHARAKVKNLGKVINFGSIKHKLLMLAADNYITSFTAEETLLPYNNQLYKHIYQQELAQKKIISIQHGMIIHNISPYLSKNNYLVNYITANNQFEKQIITETLGYDEHEVLITGMARHDNLLETSVEISESQKVLFMPTWQRGLQYLTTTQFLSSEYYHKMVELLNNSTVLDFLQRYNLTLRVLLHPQFDKYSKYLMSEHAEIEFCSMSDVEIPTAIAQSKFLITDFSSVAVDFLFQQKNVIFYQYNKYLSHHVPSKQIQYRDIGQVVTTIEQVTEALQKLAANDFKLLPQYQIAYDKLFEVKHHINQTLVDTIKQLK